jgi:Mlc titration factor MtfA (ptsG expression regulator)
MKTGCGGAAFIHPGDQSVTKPQDYLGSVVINAQCWIGTREQQAAGLTLHEFAHAWHCMNWPCFEGDTQIEEAYEAAMASGIYDVTEDKAGFKRRHYGATNKQEYFATLTEAWFWERQNYPFNRDDLLKHDPLGAAAVQAAWSVAP